MVPVGAKWRASTLAGVLVPLTTIVLIATAVLAALTAWYLLRNRLVDDRLLLVGAVVEVLLIVQAIASVVTTGGMSSSEERATMVAYALTLPIVPPAVLFLTIKEKSRWSMAVVLAGAFTVAVMTYRILQIWQTYA